MLERWFQLQQAGTTLRREATAGIVTFLTMAYIIVVQPAVLSGRMLGLDTGMDFGAVTTATCLAAALGTLIMGIWARWPVALAPGMGQNYFFVLSTLPAAAAIPGVEHAWQAGLAVVFISGLLFLVLSISGIREALLDALSPSMKHAIGAGIGLFIAFIGLQSAGIVVDAPTLVRLTPRFDSPDVAVFCFGLLLSSVLFVRGVPGSILWGIVGATVAALALREWLPHSACAGSAAVQESLLMTRLEVPEAILALPSSPAPTLLAFDFRTALLPQMLPFVLIFLFMDLFDTLGTLVAVGQRAGLMHDNKLSRARRALVADSTATVAGACLGTSTVTCFIESAAGVEQGGRTGLTAVVVALCFLLALPLGPLVSMLGGYPPVYAPALVLVGAMMARGASEIDWNDAREAIPAFLTMLGIPLSYSIADGLALGLVSYPLVQLLGGRARRANWLMLLLAAVLAAYFLLVRPMVGG